MSEDSNNVNICCFYELCLIKPTKMQVAVFTCMHHSVHFWQFWSFPLYHARNESLNPKGDVVSLYVLHSINVIVIQGAFCLWCSFVKCADASIFQWLGMSPKIVLSTTCLCKTFIHFVFLLIIPSDKKKRTEFSELIVLGRPRSGCLGHNRTSHLLFLWR